MEKNAILDGSLKAVPPTAADRRREEPAESFDPSAGLAGLTLGTDAAPPVRTSARRGRLSNRSRRPVVPAGDIWLDVDVAEYLKISVRTVKRIANEGPRSRELDLRLARPVFVGDRRWFAENVKALVMRGAAQ